MPRIFLLCAVAGALASVMPGQQGKPDAKPEAATPKAPLPPSLPPDAHVAQSIHLNGKPINYTATVGTLQVKNADGKATGEVVYTSYVVDGADRPVTFAFNGGPGAAWFS